VLAVLDVRARQQCAVGSPDGDLALPHGTLLCMAWHGRRDGAGVWGLFASASAGLVRQAFPTFAVNFGWDLPMSHCACHEISRLETPGQVFWLGVLLLLKWQHMRIARGRSVVGFAEPLLKDGSPAAY
jgi:hypothetical protein